MAEKRKLDGLVGLDGGGGYPKLEVDVTNLTRGVARPVGGTNLNTEDNIVFKISVKPDQMIRFEPNCISLLVDVKYKQKAYNAAGVNDTIKTEYHFLRPVEELPPVYPEPAVSGGIFFTDVEVEVDDHTITGPRLGTHGWIYTTFNRTFCTEKARLERYGGPIARVSTEDDGKFANLEKSPDLKAALNQLQFDGKLVSTSRLLRWSPDGVYPFDSQSNLCRATSGVVNSNGFLPPGVRLLFRFNKRNKLDQCLENAGLADTSYYGTTPVDDAHRFEYQFTLKAMEITYEIMTLPPKPQKSEQPKHKKSKKDDEEEKRMRKQWFYYVDVPRLHLQLVTPDQQVTNNTVTIPAGAKIVALMWMKSHQVHYNKASHKNLSARFHFPHEAKHVTLEMDGKMLLFEKGLFGCGIPEDAHVSRSCMDYHQTLVQKGLYSKGFSSMFPTSGNGYDGALILDLSSKVVKKPTDLEIEVTYKTTSKPGWVLCSIVLTQWRYNYVKREGMLPVLVI